MTYSQSPESRVRELGRDAGFDLVRIARAQAMHLERARYLEWVEQGRQGEMRWITRDWVEKSADPRTVLPDARSVVSVAMAYPIQRRPNDATGRGRIARYAWGRDYHNDVGERLQRLTSSLRLAFGSEQRWYVDTGRQMDKALAVRSGLGWYGRNTNVLTERFGSFVVLGEVITTLDLRADRAIDRDCGRCRLCVAACPTGALQGDYTIDARTCISYLTIEHRGPIPIELRDAIGAWVFGCDICQDVCPPSMLPRLKSLQERRAWTREVRQAVESARSASLVPNLDATSSARYTGTGAREAVDLVWLLELSHAEYLEAFRGTAMRRAKVWMLRRNAAVALGNVGGADSARPIGRALINDEHPIVRGHAAWALARLHRRFSEIEVNTALREAMRTEGDAGVLWEIENALGQSLDSSANE